MSDLGSGTKRDERVVDWKGESAKRTARAKELSAAAEVVANNRRNRRRLKATAKELAKRQAMIDVAWAIIETVAPSKRAKKKAKGEAALAITNAGKRGARRLTDAYRAIAKPKRKAKAASNA